MGLLRVRHDPASAAVVRQHISDDLEARSVTTDTMADVLLVATELIGNAVVHAVAVGDLDVRWDIDDSSVVVRVNDSSRDDPRPRDADPLATSGRGLTIVAALAAEWGVDHVAEGKQVWARVPIATSA